LFEADRATSPRPSETATTAPSFTPRPRAPHTQVPLALIPCPNLNEFKFISFSSL
jgi:hypothetical protein